MRNVKLTNVHVNNKNVEYYDAVITAAVLRPSAKHTRVKHTFHSGKKAEKLQIFKQRDLNFVKRVLVGTFSRPSNESQSEGVMNPNRGSFCYRHSRKM